MPHVWFGLSDSASLCFIFLILNTDDKYFPSGPLRDCLRTKNHRVACKWWVWVSQGSLPSLMLSFSLWYWSDWNTHWLNYFFLPCYQIWKGHSGYSFWGFLHSSVGKESASNAGDPSLIPGSERPTGEGTGYPLQYSWASLVAQLVKNLPAMQETWVQSLGWEDPLGKGKATPSSILAWRIPWTV